MNITKMVQSIVRYSKHLDPNLRILSFDLILDKKEIETDQVTALLKGIDDERDIMYLRGWIDRAKMA